MVGLPFALVVLDIFLHMCTNRPTEMAPMQIVRLACNTGNVLNILIGIFAVVLTKRASAIDALGTLDAAEVASSELLWLWPKFLLICHRITTYIWLSLSMSHRPTYGFR